MTLQTSRDPERDFFEQTTHRVCIFVYNYIFADLVAIKPFWIIILRAQTSNIDYSSAAILHFKFTFIGPLKSVTDM